MPPGVAGRKTAPTGVMSPKVFHPTMEEFSNFLGYIEKIEREDNAHLAGIAKIVPPKEWVPRKAGYNLEDLNFEIEGPIKQRFQQVGSRGCYQTKGIIQQKLNVVDYHKMATSQKYNTPNHADYDDLERKYWKSLQFVPPVYGCDVSSNISDPELEIWNIAKLDSILKYVSKDLNTVIQGVNSPYLYFGMWKATFSWHVEDMDLYGINMVHHGAPKTWYCVPPQHGHLMEKACRSLFPNVASWCSNFMRHKTCLIAPDILDKYGVPYQKVVQEERDIIVVFPYAYHSGFNHGFNIAESTNFATERWIEYGKRQRPCDCDRSRVKFSMDEFVKRFQPENFEAWMKNLDIAPHPEDPPEVVSEINLRAENPAEYARQLEQKLRKTEEKRLKKFEQQKESKLSTSQQSSSDESGSMLVYVYRHVEYSQIEVELNAKSLKFHSGKQILVDFLQKDEIDVQELIRNGLLVKVADRRIKRSKRKAPEHSSTTEQTHITEQRMVEMYKHCTEENIHITVDPLTKELTSPPSTKLLDFIKTAGDDVTIKQLIEMGVFSRVCECIMEIKKVEVLSESQPPSKKLKSDPDAAENSWLQQVTADIGATGPPMIKHLVIYRHRTTGDHLTVSALRKKVIGRKTEKVIQMLDGKSVEQLIDEGLLIKVGERKTRSGVPLKPKETPTSSIGVVKRALFRLSFDDEEKGGTFELASNGQTSVYSFEMNEDLMAVLITTKANQDNLSALGPEDQCHTPLEIIQSLLSPTLSIKPCPRHPVGGEKQDGCVACVNGSDLQGAFPARKAIMGNDYKSVNEAAKSIQQGFDASKGVITFKHVDKNRVYLVKTEQLAASLFPSTTSFKKGPSVKDEIKEAEGQNEDTDEEELFTSDDSSESNDESSDDPDYYGSGSVKEWKSNSKSRSTKKKKRLMRQMRTERLTRRNGHSNGSSKKRQTRIINSTHTLREVTKKMLERTYPEGNQLFQLDDLVSEIGEERVLIMKVIRILRGFNAIQKVLLETAHNYFL
jgi:jumonji domain-containing protein 2